MTQYCPATQQQGHGVLSKLVLCAPPHTYFLGPNAH